MSIRNLVFPLFAFISLISCDNEGFTPEPIPRQQFIIDNPQQYGFDAAVLQNVSDYAGSINNFYALMVIRDGTVIMENYYNGTGADAQFELRSITKNFSSCLAGMAIEEGLIDNLDETIQSSFPESVEGDKAGISIRHLLNMTSGISWNEDSDYFTFFERGMTDPIKTYLLRPLNSMPGETFNYNTLSPHVVSHIISERAGEPFLDYARRKLFEPLGITDYTWPKNIQGAVWGGVGLRMTPRGVAKFAQLYLDGGQHEGQQLVPADYVTLSTQPVVELSQPNRGYSLQWWINDEGDDRIYSGQGYGGQGMMIVPDKQLIVLGFQQYNLPPGESDRQWNRFFGQMFMPIYLSVD